MNDVQQKASASENAGKLSRIVEDMRASIIGGRYLAGEAMPSRRELARRFGVSMLTAHRAMSRLEKEGFVLADGRRGTSVVPRLPNQTDYVLAFHHHPGDAPRSVWSRFWSTLATEAVAVERGGQCKVNILYGVENHADNEAHTHLLRLARSHRIAGLILPQGPEFLEGSPLLEIDHLPKVSIAVQSYPHRHLGIVKPDMDGLLECSLQALKEQDCRRVALLAGEGGYGGGREMFLDRLRAAGFQSRPSWVHVVYPRSGGSVRSLVELLLDNPADRRPDGLLLLDDHLLEPTMAALLASKVAVPSELKVVSHCNFPDQRIASMPVTPVGFDVAEILQSCFELLTQVAGCVEPTSPIRLVPARHQRELSGRLNSE